MISGIDTLIYIQMVFRHTSKHIDTIGLHHKLKKKFADIQKYRGVANHGNAPSLH